MLLRMGAGFEIDNSKEYPDQAVQELRALLVEGVTARPDPKRRDFYDIELDDRAFFVYLSPSGSVMLLAMWVKRPVSLSAA